jgi:16S rRNA (cytidine1402-2'-O)-methyltransferase
MRTTEQSMGTLYVIATPIGNLGDMTQRAIETLRAVSLIAAEDTRRTRQLLNHFGIENRLISYHSFNERARRDALLAALANGDVALVTDAGTPGIADPAADIVRAALDAGYSVSPIPGASALVAAASASGLIGGPFVMLGFLPRGGNDRRVLIGRAVAAQMPLVCFESPNRLGETLTELREALGDRPAAVMRELTKLHEEVISGTLGELADRFENADVRGEIVIVIGAPDVDGSTEADPRELMRGLLATGMKPSLAAREAAGMTGLPRSELYDLAQEIRKSNDERLTTND